MILAGAMALALLGLLSFAAGLGAWYPLIELAGAGCLAVVFRLIGPGRSTHREIRSILDHMGTGTPVLLVFQSAY